MDYDAVLVAALGAAVLGACTSGPEPAPLPTPPSATPEPVDPDLAVLRAWYVAESTMAGRYGAFLDFATHHTLHAEAVGEHLRVRGEPFPAVRARGPYRGKRAALLKAFGTRERELAAQYQAALPGVRDPKVAALGAELYAAARAYAAVLRIEKP